MAPPSGQPSRVGQTAIERALFQEAYLAQALLCAGMTAIRRASFGSPGRMYEAFFGLSNGVERIAKLALAASEYATSGAFPDPEELKRKGHDLKRLIREVEDIAVDRGMSLDDAPSRDDGSKAVIAFLSKFAMADRYYNINRWTQGDSATIDDPIRRWVDLVRAQAPTRPTRVRQAHIESLAAAQYLDSRAPLAIISGHSLDGQTHLTTFASLAEQEQNDQRVAVEGMLLAVRPLRFLSKTISRFDQARYPLPMFSEIFNEWTSADSYLRRRKQFPLGR